MSGVCLDFFLSHHSPHDARRERCFCFFPGEIMRQEKLSERALKASDLGRKLWQTQLGAPGMGPRAVTTKLGLVCYLSVTHCLRHQFLFIGFGLFLFPSLINVSVNMSLGDIYERKGNVRDQTRLISVSVIFIKGKYS